MGTGKTLGSIERDLRFRANNPGSWRTLVVAPMDTHQQWRRALEGETEDDAVVRVIDPKNRDKFLRDLDDAHFFVMHYEALRLMPELRGLFHHGIFDECHRLKNRKAKQTVAAKKLQIPYLTDMSGSPADNRPADFWSPLNHLWPKAFSSYWKFFDAFVEHEIVYPGGYKKATGPKPAWKSKGLPAIANGYSRVLKKDVMDLPPKVFEKIYVDLSPEQRRQYEDIRDEMITWVKSQREELEPLIATAAIAKLQRLQQFALGAMTYNDETDRYMMSLPSSKVERLIGEIEENDTEQFVVFSQFKGPLILLDRELRAKGIGSVKHTGDESRPQRDRARDSFSQGEAQCFLATIRAGGEGIDGLQNNCNRVVFLDRDWSPMKNEQAEDRLHRGGQRRSVQVTDIMAKDTIDFERAVTVENKKQWLLEMLGDK